MAKYVYVVIAWNGLGYDDRLEWPVAVFEEREQAEAYSTLIGALRVDAVPFGAEGVLSSPIPSHPWDREDDEETPNSSAP